MRIFALLQWLLRIQVMLGLVQYVGLFAGFAWPPQVWMGHRVIALVAPAIALVAFRRGAWGGAGRVAPLFEPAVRVSARFALFAPLALGLCFSTGVLGGRAWVTVHIAVAIAAMLVIERASTAAVAASKATNSAIGTTPEPPALVNASAFGISAHSHQTEGSTHD